MTIRISANRGLRLDIINVEILQHILVANYFHFNRSSMCMRDYRNRLIIKIGRNLKFDRFVMKDIAYVHSSNTFAGKRKFNSIPFAIFSLLMPKKSR